MTDASAPDTLLERLLAEILRDGHQYEPGIAPYRGAKAADPRSRAARTAELAREQARDVLERGMARVGFTHRHYDPAIGAARLARIIELWPRLLRTFERLGDEASERALLNLLKLRVVGPYHASLGLAPERYRGLQARAERDLVITADTFEVADPWFSPLSLYRLAGTPEIRLHGHSVDIVNVFELGEYTYDPAGGAGVTVQPGDTVLDIGGCWGDTALYFARRAGPEGRVFTFEFDPGNLEIMRMNLALNPELAERIEVVEAALWSESGVELPFVAGGRMTRVGVGGDGGRAAAVSTVTLDELVDRIGIERVDFVKMDVEGAELEVIGGADRMLRRSQPKLGLAAYHRDDDLVTIPEALVGAGIDHQLFVRSTGAVEDETVLFGRATAHSNSM
jgi:FkbM family methyltransferase